MAESYTYLHQRSRQLPQGRYTWISGLKASRTTPWSLTKRNFDSVGYQDTWSAGHPYQLLGKGKDSTDVGGPFRTEKRYWTLALGAPEGDASKLQLTKGLSRSDGGYPLYTGEAPALPRLLPTSRASFPPTLASTEAQLWVDGTTAIARCKPSNSTANLAQALIELKRDGIPAVPGKGSVRALTQSEMKLKRRIADAAGEYLNVEFGWVPLYNDVASTLNSVVNADTIWKQYLADAGKWVRRSYRFPAEETYELLASTTNKVDPNGFSTPVYSSYQGAYTVERYVRRQKWFSGAFTYSLAGLEESGPVAKLYRYAAFAHHVLGLGVNPKVLYEVMPWSWLIDWFSNLGDVISNLSDSLTDRLVMPYGYIMEHVTVSDVYHLTGIGYRVGNSGPLTRQLCLVTETKQRVAASPYGFGLKTGDLSSAQLAILAALGLSQGGSAVPHVR